MRTSSSPAKRITGIALAGCAILCATLGAASSAAASQQAGATSDFQAGALGGWTETASVSQPPTPGARATVNHRGKAEFKTIGGTTNKRAHGWTTWAGTKHYTTAQLEKTWPSSGVITTSGRKWGTGGTEAVSAYRAFNPNQTSDGYGQARTYYGR
jgi:hypothetical protein